MYDESHRACAKDIVQSVPTAAPDNAESTFNRIISTPRKRATPEEKACMEYIKAQLVLCNYTTTVQEFPIHERSDKKVNWDIYNLKPEGSEFVGTGNNLIAEKNYDSTKKTIIFSAHYDTTNDSIGAVDNASGTTVLLEAAKLIAEKQFDYNVRIIFFSAEELHFYGSASYVLGLSEEELANIIACINIDMTSTTKWRQISIAMPNAKANKLSDEFFRVNGEGELIYGGNSDEMAFTGKGILGVNFITMNPRRKDFDFSVLKKETANTYVDVELIKEDAKTVSNFMEKLDINNLL